MEKIYKSIIRISKNYYLASLHGLFGINTGDILCSCIDEFNDSIIPSIKALSNKDKQNLLFLLQSISDYKDMEPGISKRAIEILKSHLEMDTGKGHRRH